MKYYYTESEERRLEELIRELNINPDIQRLNLDADPEEFRETRLTLEENPDDKVLKFYQEKFRSEFLIYLAAGDFQILGLAEIDLAGESVGYDFKTFNPEETNQWREKIEQEPGYIKNRNSLKDICLPSPIGIFSKKDQETYLLSYLEHFDPSEEKLPASTSFLLLKLGKKIYLDLDTCHGGLWDFQSKTREPTRSFFQ
ncbi:MAG: hypothetical protein KAT77_03260 [Nanoarchaeota archaeon]|nr:hypothetical protein [Nanoarchaeota archaeon]